MRRTSRIAVFIVALGGLAEGQGMLDPRMPRFQTYVDEFEKAWAGPRSLNCRLEHFPPRLSFTFRYVSSFAVTLPARQFTGKDRSMAIAIRVTPEGGKPAYLGFRSDLPEIPADVGKNDLYASGGFLLGAGNYRVDTVVVDDQGRNCGKSWTEKIAAKKGIELTQAPNTVSSFNVEAWKGLEGKAADRRLTVFLHAVPLYRRRHMNHLPAYDRAALLGSLSSILNQSDFGHVRLVAYDLLGKRVLFQTDRLDPKEYARLYRTLDRATYGTIDAKVLAQGFTDAELIGKLLREELDRPEKSEAVLFLGAEGYMVRHVPEVLEAAAQDLPRALYVGFLRFQIPAEDVMFRVVKKARGKRIMLIRPQDLVSAIRALNGKQ